MTNNYILEVKNLKKTYDIKGGFLKEHQKLQALREVNFKLEKGKTLAVVGESGCGKSTLAKQITKLETPTEGNIIVDGIDVHNTSRRSFKIQELISFIFQNPYSSLNPRFTIGQIIAEPLNINHKELGKEEIKNRVKKILDEVRLSYDNYDRYPHQLSGGQRQRVAIARALVLSPKLIIADEPTSALDVSVQAQVLNILRDLKKEHDLSLIFISHDLSVVEFVADDIIVMYLGRIVEKGNKHDIFKNPKHPYTKALLSATPHIKPSNRIEKIVLSGDLPSPLNPPIGCSFLDRCPKVKPECHKFNKEFTKLSDSHKVSCLLY